MVCLTGRFSAVNLLVVYVLSGVQGYYSWNRSRGCLLTKLRKRTHFHFCRGFQSCIDWGAGTRGTPFFCSDGPVFKTSIVSFDCHTKLFLQIFATFRYSIAVC